MKCRHDSQRLAGGSVSLLHPTHLSVAGRYATECPGTRLRPVAEGFNRIGIASGRFEPFMAQYSHRLAYRDAAETARFFEETECSCRYIYKN
jgi:hypothetical protein